MNISTKSILSILSLFFTFTFTYAQVGIGTSNPSASAQLDVSSTSKGFLPPRVELTATNAAGPISSPATGLLVYNTATAGTSPNNVEPGYYYNSGTPASVQWTRLNNGLTGSIPSWTVAGTVQSVGLSATTTAPTLPTSPTRNQVLYKQLGPKTWQVMVVMEWSSPTGAADGNGDYLFTLPNGLSFDTNIEAQQAYQGNVGVSSFVNLAKALPGNIVNITHNYYGNASFYGSGPLVWNATQYRIPISFGGSFRSLGSGFFQFNITGASYAWTFTFQSL